MKLFLVFLLNSSKFTINIYLIGFQFILQIFFQFNVALKFVKNIQNLSLKSCEMLNFDSYNFFTESANGVKNEMENVIKVAVFNLN